jgi:hypothetical protein
MTARRAGRTRPAASSAGPRIVVPVTGVERAKDEAERFEREHGLGVEDAYGEFVRLRRRGFRAWVTRRFTSRRAVDVLEEGAHQWLDLRAAERRDAHAVREQRRLALAERGEAFSEEVIDALRRNDARGG